VVAGKRNEVVDGQAKGREVAQRSADDPENDVESESLLYDRGPETPLFVLVGEINVPHVLEAVPFLFGQKRFGEALGVVGGEWWVVLLDRSEGAVAAPGGRIAGGQMNIRTIVLDADRKVFIDMSKDLMVGHGL